MSKLLAATVAVMFAFGTTAVLAADKGAEKAAPKVMTAAEKEKFCKDPKNKDHKDCVAPAKKADKKKDGKKGDGKKKDK